MAVADPAPIDRELANAETDANALDINRSTNTLLPQLLAEGVKLQDSNVPQWMLAPDMINVWSAPKVLPLLFNAVKDSVIRVPGRCLAPPPEKEVVTPLMMCSGYAVEDAIIAHLA